MNDSRHLSRPLVLLTRPADELSRAEQLLNGAGFDVISAPILRVEPIQRALPSGNFDSLLFTSPRSPGLVHANHPELMDLPIAAVGPRTAQVIQALGHKVQLAGATDGNAIVQQMKAAGFRRILQPGGGDRRVIDVPDEVSLTPWPVYKAIEVPLAPEVLQRIADAGTCLVMLFSPRSAQLFRHQMDQAGLSPQALQLVALSQNVVDAAGAGWNSYAISNLPNLREMVAAAEGLCHI